MKLNKTILLSVLSLLVVSCGKSDNSSIEEKDTSSIQESSQISEQESIEESNVDTSQYAWYYRKNQAYRGTHNFSIDTKLYDRDLKLLIDNEEIDPEPISSKNLDCYIEYTFDKDNFAHSDTVEHAFNEMTWNGESMGAIPSDDSKRIPIDFDVILDGENYFSLTTGRVYTYNQKYDMSLVHGGTNGACDDYEIKNVHLVTSSGTVIQPSKLVLYKPVDQTSKNYRKIEVDYEEDKFYWIADGWHGNLSYDGNPTEKYNCPFRIDFYFEYEMPNDFFGYSVDTTKYSDGTHNVVMKDGNETIFNYDVIFDNSGPEIELNISNYDYLTDGYVLEISNQDKTSGIDSYSYYLDGKQINTEKVALSNMNLGNHNISIQSIDKAGNVSYLHRSFNITNNIGTISVNDNSVTVPYQSNANVEVYEANKLNYSSLNPLNELKQSSTTVPYDEFTIDSVDENGAIYVSYDGEIASGERLKFEAYNPTSAKYEQILLTSINRPISFYFDPKKYVDNQSVKIKVSPQYYGNGSNRLLWSSDTQYLPKTEFSDINYMYGALMNYVVSEYSSNKMCYFVHTGDIVDNHPGYGNDAVKEWVRASEAFKKLDDNNVPYGVCAGNHDVGTNVNYIYFNEYFGINRYQANDYYGGSLNNNGCHFDLITLDNHDYIFLYLGYGIEATEETINWANETLKTYRHRNAIVATHAYLLPNGKLDEASNAQLIYDRIVVPNENVKFVFSGHTDGCATVKKQIDDNRYVYEILNCYQFVQKETYSVSHKISGYDCNGEGYIKELIFNDNNIQCHTFSPVTNGKNPFGAEDEFNINVDLYEPNRSLKTSSFTACQINHKLDSFTSSINTTGNLNISFENGKDYLIYSSDDKGFGFYIK